MKFLEEKELNEFVDKYFKPFKGDIHSVSLIEYIDTYEYLVNGHYLFVVNKKEL